MASAPTAALMSMVVMMTKKCSRSTLTAKVEACSGSQSMRLSRSLFRRSFMPGPLAASSSSLPVSRGR